MDSPPKSALQEFLDAKANPRAHPETIQRLWQAYCESTEREMIQKAALGDDVVS